MTDASGPFSAPSGSLGVMVPQPPPALSPDAKRVLLAKLRGMGKFFELLDNV